MNAPTVFQIIVAISIMLGSVLVLALTIRFALATPLRLISSFFGWNRLSAEFPPQPTTAVSKRLFCTAGHGWVRYRGCVKAIADRNYLTLEIMSPFASSREAISIPIHRLKRLDAKGWFCIDKFEIEGTELTIYLSRTIQRMLPEPQEQNSRV